MTQIVNFNAILSDKAQLADIGSEITKRAVVAALEAKMELPPSYAPGMRVVNKGDLVPSDLIQKVKVGAGGIAADGWSDKGWTDIGIWERATWDKTGDPKEKFGIESIRTLPVLERTKVLSKLDASELQVLRQLKYID